MNIEGIEYDIDEHVVLEKFEGDPEDGKLVERLTILNGEIINKETFTLEGGDSNSSN